MVHPIFGVMIKSPTDSTDDTDFFVLIWAMPTDLVLLALPQDYTDES